MKGIQQIVPVGIVLIETHLGSFVKPVVQKVKIQLVTPLDAVAIKIAKQIMALITSKDSRLFYQ